MSGSRLGLPEEDQTTWRNAVFDLAKTLQVQAVVAFGSNARLAARGWTGRGDLPLVEVHHPSFPDEDALLEGWRNAVIQASSIDWWHRSTCRRTWPRRSRPCTEGGTRWIVAGIPRERILNYRPVEFVRS